ncbi:MAG TPA: DEAD/DEAH box helicase family protein [Candidatus Thermoplasmatota archaeon]|nr:DEAD/DEAH box helicase family protein [Candidatus Thermoplasmatota archaeon]
MRVAYDRGTLVVRGAELPQALRGADWLRWDPRSRFHRAEGYRYRALRERLEAADVEAEDEVLDLIPAEEETLAAPGLTLRSYQEEALAAWEEGGRAGIIVLPTGAGKTVVAIKAIESLSTATLVVVPTLDLLEQWRARLREAFQVPVGAIARGETLLHGITVTTYDSAYLQAERLGNRFELVVFDEVHHLPSEGYRQIAQLFASPYRLGLTATLERPDGFHELLPDLVGPKVYEATPAALAGDHLSPYTAETIFTDLTPEERRRYEDEHGRFQRFVERHGGRFRGVEGHKRLIMASGRDPDARAALLARERARDVMMNSEAKLRLLGELLLRHREDRVLVFTEHNRLVYAISERFLLPALTHQTGDGEREELLARFRAGKYRVLVTSKVLNEGVDVPEANVGIILSGSGTRREFVQRLGRILRKQEGKHAYLYELVSRDTREVHTSERRAPEKPKAKRGGRA